MAHAAAPPLRILPLGDSITFGTGVPGGYREPLYQLLTQAGYAVEFVGSQDANGHTDLPSPRHEGHPNFRIRDLDRLVFRTLDSVPDPDVILLLAGTNDFGRSDEVDSASDRLEALVSKLATERPWTHIVVASLIPRAERSGGADRFDRLIRTIFNPRLPGLVDRQAALGRKVHFTDMRMALELADTSDRLHPNALGYRKMATNWFQAIQRIAGPNGDTHPPAVARVESLDTETLKVTFTKPVRNDSVVKINFLLADGAVEVLDVSLDATHQREVTIRTGTHSHFAAQTLRKDPWHPRPDSGGPADYGRHEGFLRPPAAGGPRSLPQCARGLRVSSTLQLRYSGWDQLLHRIYLRLGHARVFPGIGPCRVLS